MTDIIKSGQLAYLFKERMSTGGPYNSLIADARRVPTPVPKAGQQQQNPAPAQSPAGPAPETVTGSVGTYGLNSTVKPDKRPKGRISTLLTGLGNIAESLGD